MQAKNLILFLIAIVLSACQNKSATSNTLGLQINDPIVSKEVHPHIRYDDFYFLDSLMKNKLIYRWKNWDGIVDTTYLTDSVQTIVDRIDTLKLNGRIVYAVQTESRPPKMNFHTAGALCFICFFEENNPGIARFVKLSRLYDESPLTMFGSWGAFPGTEMILIGTNRYAYQVEPSFMGQGQIGGSLMLFEVTDSFEIRNVLSIEGAVDHRYGQMKGDYSGYDTKIEFLDESGDYYKIKAVKKGEALTPKADKIINIDTTFYYIYKDRRYVLTKTVVNEKDTDSK